MDIERSMQRAKSLLVPWPGIWSLELALRVRGRYCSGSVEKMRASLLPIAPQQHGLQDTPWAATSTCTLRSASCDAQVKVQDTLCLRQAGAAYYR